MPDADVKAVMTRVMQRRREPASPGGLVHRLQRALGLAQEGGPAPSHVHETFKRIFEQARQALGAQDDDFVLGNLSLKRSGRGVRLSYRWREDREETVSCSCGGRSVTLARNSFLGNKAQYRISKRLSAERDGTHLSASDDRQNGQISEADCRAVEDLFERAHQAVAR